MDKSLKRWQWGVVVVLSLIGAVNALLAGGPPATMAGQMTGNAVGSVVLVHVVVIAGRTIKNTAQSASAAVE